MITPLHILAAILASARQSKRQARALCNAAGLGGGSRDLALVLQAIKSHPRRAEIYAAAAVPASPTDPHHERWILGQGESGRQYVIHTHSPRFIAELFVAGEEPLGGISLVLPDSGEIASNIAWIDPVPDETELIILRKMMADALEESDYRAELEIDAERERDS